MSEVPVSVAGMSVLPPAPFGRLITAMVTPFLPDGSLDLDGAAALASHLVDAGSDGLVISGTTGESPTTSDDEKDQLLRVVLKAVGDRASVIAGVGTYDTHHTTELARAAERAGAHGLLVVTPYYSKPPQAGVARHFRMVADATGLPVMIYDIPGRTGVPVTTETLLALAEHPNIVAVKDAKADLEGSSRVIANSSLAYYCGDDALTLPLLSVGAVGLVSVVAHVGAPALRALIAAFDAGDPVTARRIHQGMLPIFKGIFRTQGVITTKAALTLRGLPAGPVRPPLVDATDAEIDQLRLDLAAAVLEPSAAPAFAAAPAGAAAS
ncbi:4-hydroxy-tetrahydrodipicolinate synthase [Pseudofrankia asymbiotica]|uniref:4-hydroxy-tetrahydrodipicolinate synthase n=2 Tax=Pseudofrankia asymbiotica TaxID=1834516 RepID=A0A1V2IFN6_9ACTN|nr:4-hydroxy-tetrahydrodipicolinate synthase [Pseudofrankia asymbiotica]ONH31271.1 4-hydroxy-tetrahydrodipicolinate synthase [Pseudofrankia asymbiotica]